MTHATTRLLPAALGLLLALPVMAQTTTTPAAPPSAMAERDAEVTAVVESVDLQQRQVLLRGADGSLATVKVGPNVRNLAQVRAGDTVRVAYMESLVAELAPPGAPLTASSDVAAIRAQPGQRPGAAAVERIRVRVRVLDVDQGSGTVRFVGPNGQPRTAVVKEPAMLDLLRQIKPGDEVNLTYTEALAISVTPTR
jgi:antitoxin (DNA-binding transcriptional repressor) of toxin-antitoxin stability system